MFGIIAGDENTKQMILKTHKDMEEHPQIQNTHKYYEMTRKEQ